MKIRRSSAFFALALPLLAAASAACSSDAATDEEEGADEGALASEAVADAFIGEAAGRPSLPSNFESLAAHDKQKLVWEKVSEPGEIRCNLAAAVRNARERLMEEMTICEREGSMPKSTLANTGVDAVQALARRVFLNAGLLKPAFDNGGDEIEPGRKKLLHPYGATAKVEFRHVAEQTPYTGVFEGGGRRPSPGIARISSGGAEAALGGFVPGMGLKFFVQGAPSIDMHVMHGMRPQREDEGQNPFARPFSNEFETQGASTFIKLGMRIFDLVHKPSNLLPLDQTAVRTWNGASFQAPVAPRKVIFEPAPAIKAAAADFVRQNPKADHRTVLLAVTKDADEDDKAVPLYTVRTDRGVVLGTLVATSPFVPSRFGDRQLFFRHHHGCDRRGASPVCGGLVPRVE